MTTRRQVKSDIASKELDAVEYIANTPPGISGSHHGGDTPLKQHPKNFSTNVPVSREAASNKLSRQLNRRADGHLSARFLDIGLSKNTVQISVLVQNLDESELTNFKRHFAKCSFQEVTPV